MESTKKFNWKHVLLNIPAFLSLISSIVYCTWYFAEIENKLALTQQHQIEISARVDLIRDEQDKMNEKQDSQITNYQSEIRGQIAQLNGRIEQIYEILLEGKRQKLE